MLPLVSCSASPAQEILGSFFPAWMLCAAIGVAGAVVGRRLLVAVGVNEWIPAAPLTYIGLAAAVTLLIWLIWFSR